MIILADLLITGVVVVGEDRLHRSVVQALVDEVVVEVVEEDIIIRKMAIIIIIIIRRDAFDLDHCETDALDSKVNS